MSILALLAIVAVIAGIVIGFIKGEYRESGTFWIAIGIALVSVIPLLRGL